MKARGGGLTGVTVTPVLLGESPSYFHRRGEVRVETRHSQPDVASEPYARRACLLSRPDLYSPQPPSVLLDVRSYTGDNGVTFVAGQALRHEFHDDRVIIESGEGLEV